MSAKCRDLRTLPGTKFRLPGTFNYSAPLMRGHGSKLVEVVTLLARYKVEELLPLVEEKVKKAQVGEKDLAGLIVMVNDGGPQSKVSFSGQQLGF